MAGIESKIKIGESFTIVDLKIVIAPTIAVGSVRWRISEGVNLMSAKVVRTQDEEEFQRIFLKQAKPRKFQTFEICTRPTVEPFEYADTVYSNTKGLYLFVRNTGLDSETLSGILDGCRNGIIVPSSVPSLNGSVEFKR